MYRTFILNFQGVVYLGYAALEVVIYPRLDCAVVFYYG